MTIKSLYILLLLSTVLYFQSATGQLAYQIVNAKGEKVKFTKMIQDIEKSDVIFFGEIHNQPISHWLNLEILKAVHQNTENVKVGMEMFEKDQQRVLTEMQAGIFKVEKLNSYTRTWNNFSTDYLPIVKYCVENGIPVQATNIPRQYASFVFSHGIDSLYTLDIPKDLLPPDDLPIDTNLVSYSEIIDMASQMGHGGGYFLEAQAIKDMMMAKSILDDLSNNSTYLHTNGVFHTKYKEGIAWYLNFMQPDLNISVISCHEKEDFEDFSPENYDKADYHILIDSDITKSYD